jgi:hypothetical protein
VGEGFSFSTFCQKKSSAQKNNNSAKEHRRNHLDCARKKDKAITHAGAVDTSHQPHILAWACTSSGSRYLLLLLLRCTTSPRRMMLRLFLRRLSPGRHHARSLPSRLRLSSSVIPGGGTTSSSSSSYSSSLLSSATTSAAAAAPTRRALQPTAWCRVGGRTFATEGIPPTPPSPPPPPPAPASPPPAGGDAVIEITEESQLEDVVAASSASVGLHSLPLPGGVRLVTWTSSTEPCFDAQ